MLAGGPHNADLIPWDEFRWTVYAREFGWTPEQCDSLPLNADIWLIPINQAITAEDNRRQAEAHKKAQKAK